MSEIKQKLIHVFESFNSEYRLIKKGEITGNIENHFVYIAPSYSNFDFNIGKGRSNFTFISRNHLEQEDINRIIKKNTTNYLSTLHFNIKSINKEIDNSLKQISLFLMKMIENIDEDRLFNLGVVYRELLTNSIRYAHKGDNTKFVWIEILVNIVENIVTLVVDDGDYEFNLKKYCDNVEDITDLRTGQRGMFLIKQLSDEIIDSKKKIVRFKL